MNYGKFFRLNQNVSKIEEVYQSWINTLTEEIEDMDKGNQTSNDIGPRSELERWKFRMQRLTKVNDFFHMV